MPPPASGDVVDEETNDVGDPDTRARWSGSRRWMIQFGGWRPSELKPMRVVERDGHQSRADRAHPGAQLFIIRLLRSRSPRPGRVEHERRLMPAVIAPVGVDNDTGRCLSVEPWLTDALVHVCSKLPAARQGQRHQPAGAWWRGDEVAGVQIPDESFARSRRKSSCVDHTCRRRSILVAVTAGRGAPARDRRLSM